MQLKVDSKYCHIHAVLLPNSTYTQCYSTWDFVVALLICLELRQLFRLWYVITVQAKHKWLCKKGPN